MYNLKTVVIVWAGLIFVGSSYGEYNWVPFIEGVPEGAPEFNVLESDANHTVVEVNTPGMWVEDVTVEGVNFQRIIIPEYEYIYAGAEGRPEIPAVSEFVAVPGNKNVTFNIIETQQTIMEDYWIYPLQPDFVPADGEPEFTIDEDFYANYDGFYTGERLTIGEPAIWRDLRVVPFSFRPVRFNPATQEIEVTYYMKFELVYEGESDINVKEDPDYPIEKTYADMYRASVINYEELNLAETGWDMGSECKYLIITAPRYETDLTPLTIWLRERGFPVFLRKTVDIPGWAGPNKTLAVHEFIKKMYEGYWVKYVLLVGRQDELPAPLLTSNIYPAGFVLSDHYYSCVTGSDLIPDLAVGRLLECRDHLLWFDGKINKIITYAKDPAPGDWPGNVLLVAHHERNEEKDKDFQQCKESIRTYSGYDHFQPSFYCLYGREGALNEDVTNFINNGAGVVNYNGHGWDPKTGHGPGKWASWNSPWHQDYWWPGEAGSASRNDKNPIVFNSTCFGGMFDFGVGYCHCEGWISTEGYHGRPYYGAVAAYGDTRGSPTKMGNFEDKQFFKAMYKWGIKTIGDVVNHGKMDVIKAYRTSKYAKDLVLMGMVMGEPSTGVKTKPIGFFNVSHPASLPSGMAFCEVSVTDDGTSGPVNDVLVCLYRDGVIHDAKMTAEDGVISFDIDDTGDPGDAAITLTVYDRNYVAYQAGIEVE